LPIRFWVDVGLLEDPWLVSGSRQLAAALREKGWVDGADLRYLEQEDGNHDEISWGSRIPDVLRFLWPRP
jgi:enterochelin esterase-like enzyme